ncbi:MAG: hypothetical protein JW812_03605, partial [Alphaproteobacteria bacterium]|nr:hypothetical protein [Alphaproteobacteria bacterium]
MKKVRLAVYDFDGTLYPGDTLRKFWAWALCHKTKPWIMLPHSLSYCLFYTFGLISKDTLKDGILKSFSPKTIKKDLNL